MVIKGNIETDLEYYANLPYTIMVEQWDDGKGPYWVARVAELPHCMIHGDTPEEAIKEIQEVLLRPKFKKYLKHYDIKEFISIHEKLCWLIDTEETTTHLSDPKDNFLLNLYNKGKATALVSGDKELLHEANELKYNVMTLREFEGSFNISSENINP